MNKKRTPIKVRIKRPWFLPRRKYSEAEVRESIKKLERLGLVEHDGDDGIKANQ